MSEYFMATSRVNFAAPGLYAAPSPTVTVPGGGANVNITSAAHGLATGNWVTVSGTTGVTGLNANWLVNTLDADHFELVGSSALTGSPAGTAAVALIPLDISGTDFSKEWYVRVKVYDTGVVSIEDTVDNWATAQTRFIANARSHGEGTEFVFNWRDFSGFHRFGVANARARIRLLSGTNVRVTVVVCTNG
jgi:hypothetical protein